MTSAHSKTFVGWVGTCALLGLSMSLVNCNPEVLDKFCPHGRADCDRAYEMVERTHEYPFPHCGVPGPSSAVREARMLRDKVNMLAILVTLVEFGPKYLAGGALFGIISWWIWAESSEAQRLAAEPLEQTSK